MFYQILAVENVNEENKNIVLLAIKAHHVLQVDLVHLGTCTNTNRSFLISYYTITFACYLYMCVTNYELYMCVTNYELYICVTNYELYMCVTNYELYMCVTNYELYMCVTNYELYMCVTSYELYMCDQL